MLGIIYSTYCPEIYFYIYKILLGNSLRCSRLRIWHCHCSSLGCCCGTALIPGPGIFAGHRQGQKKKKTKNKNKKTKQTNKQKKNYYFIIKKILFFIWQVDEIREMVDNDLGFQQAPLMCYSRTKTLLFISNDKKVVGCLIAEHIQWVSDFSPPLNSNFIYLFLLL